MEKQREIDLTFAIACCVGGAVIHQDSCSVIVKSQLVKTSQFYQFTETKRWQMITTHFINHRMCHKLEALQGVMWVKLCFDWRLHLCLFGLWTKRSINCCPFDVIQLSLLFRGEICEEGIRNIFNRQKKLIFMVLKSRLKNPFSSFGRIEQLYNCLLH